LRVGDNGECPILEHKQKKDCGMCQGREKVTTGELTSPLIRGSLCPSSQEVDRMERRNLPPFLVVFGVGVVVLASLGFVLASLGGSAGESVTTPLSPTRVPAATSVPDPLPTAASVTEPTSPLPTGALKAAPDFTLEQVDGGAFTLSEQLAQGSVVLVFFQRCG
jgi:hypothetical protein